MTDRHLDLTADRLAEEAAVRLQSVDDRRRRGAFFTPPDVASALVAEVVERGSVLDPACGGGVFLLAAARRLLEVGAADRGSIVRRHLFGADVDPASVDATRRVLGAWADVHPDEVSGVVVADPLHEVADPWSDRPVDGFDAVVGNPPFLGQLLASTSRTGADRELLRERFGDLVGAYTDAAWLFLALGLEVLAPGGRMVLIQPQSLLAARDAGPVRDRLVRSGRLTGLWLDRSGGFAGHVEGCAPIVETRTTGSQPDGPVHLLVDGSVQPAGHVPPPVPGEAWGGLVAGLLGIPEVGWVGGRSAGDGRIGDRAGVTAGFRQHYYALVGAVHERSGPADRRAPLLTTSSVDPLHSRWSTVPCRFDGRRWTAPVVDLAVVGATDPTVGSWFEARRRPKLLVATQTTVVEVVVDPVGDLVPLTPLVVVEPGPGDLWHLAAALSAPALTALAARRSVGAARSAGRIKLSASQVADLPLPADSTAWDEGADLARALHGAGWAATPDAWIEFGEVMGRAYGASEEGLLEWWWARHPARSRA